MTLVLLILNLLFSHFSWAGSSVHPQTAVELNWENPTLIASHDLKQMKDFFIAAFLKSYRLSHTRDDQSDEILKGFLSDYFDHYIQPKLQTDSELLFLSAKSNDRCVGFAIFEKLDTETVYMAELAVAEEFWRQGIGRRMTFSIFEKDLGVHKMVLITEWTNLQSQKFYESMGFKPVDYIHEGYDPADYRAYELILLNSPEESQG